jgi:hypothetical protein
MSRTRIAVTAACLTLMMSLTACGASDDDKASEAISKGLMDGDEADLQLKQEEADCVGDGWVEDIGVDKLKDYGIVTEDLGADTTMSDVTMDQADAEAAASTLVGCTDAAQLIKDTIGTEVSGEVSDCLDEAINEDDLEALFATLFAGGEPDADGEFATAITECMTPS